MEKVLRTLIKTVPDFPKPEINFLDIGPLLANSFYLNNVIDRMVLVANDLNVDKIGGFDSRGFLFGPMLAAKLNIPFFMIRKAGKLPPPVVSESYGLEYGTDKIEIQESAVTHGDNVLLIDDVLATGGTMKAGYNLVEMLGAKEINCLTLIELVALNGRETIASKYNVHSILEY